MHNSPPAEVLGLTRRWIVTMAAAVLFVLALVVSTAVMIVAAAMSGANGGY
jgi:hypothetical protein